MNSKTMKTDKLMPFQLNCLADKQIETLWLDGPARPLLDDGEVHVWRACLNLHGSRLGQLWETLSPDEQLRARKFKFQRDREHFVAARGGLRDILSRYTGSAPQSLHFSYSEYGKPSLVGETGGEFARFNVSHSDGLALYAVTAGREVGIDLERVREDFASLDIAERFFSRREVAALRALPPTVRTPAFFDCWTRKEAYIKARGEGLSRPLHLFTVSLAPGQPAALLCDDEEPEEASRWSLASLSPGEGFRAALAVKGQVRALRCWRWP
jgi:4'-phosphopantetheinyl transferase